LCDFDQEGVESRGSERRVCAKTTKSLLLNDEKVHSEELLAAKVLLLEAGNLADLFANRATLNESLLVDLVYFDKYLGDLAQAESFCLEQEFEVTQE